MIFTITKDKWIGEGRAFGSSSDPYRYLVVLLSDDGNLPSQNQEYAPGSILLNTDSSSKYIFDGEDWILWNGGSSSSGGNEEGGEGALYITDGDFTYNDIVNAVQENKTVILIEPDDSDESTSIYAYLASSGIDDNTYKIVFSNPITLSESVIYYGLDPNSIMTTTQPTFTPIGGGSL